MIRGTKGQPALRRNLALVCAGHLLVCAAVARAADAPSAPPSRRADVVDTLHGVPVADPYRWLEDQQAPEVRAWIDGQNTAPPRHGWRGAAPPGRR